MEEEIISAPRLIISEELSRTLYRVSDLIRASIMSHLKLKLVNLRFPAAPRSGFTINVARITFPIRLTSMPLNVFGSWIGDWKLENGFLLNYKWKLNTPTMLIKCWIFNIIVTELYNASASNSASWILRIRFIFYYEIWRLRFCVMLKYFDTRLIKNVQHYLTSWFLYLNFIYYNNYWKLLRRIFYVILVIVYCV